MEDICFVTGDIIYEDKSARFTCEFDAWISERGQQMIESAVQTGEIEFNPEWRIIYSEWYAEDESAAGRWNDFFGGDLEDLT